VEAVGRFESAAAFADTELTHLAGFQAFVVEMGTYLKLKGTVLAAPDVQGEVGVFPFALDRGQGITGNLEVQTHLFNGTKYYAADGTAVELGALQAGTRAMVDGVLFLSGDGISADVLKAALVIIDLSPPSDGELQGTVAAVSATDRKITLEGGECAVMTSAARFFLMQQAAIGDPVEITPTDFDSVTIGQQVRLYGNGSVGECLATDTGFVLQLAE